MQKIVSFRVGSLASRIDESRDSKAPCYKAYSQIHFIADLMNQQLSNEGEKQICTFDKVEQLRTGDIVFSFVSGEASKVRQARNGYFYSQNYVVLEPLTDKVNPDYLVFLINQDASIRRQLVRGLQGSMVLKYTLKQLKDIELPNFPTLEKQQLIASTYLKQLELQSLKQRVATLETIITLAHLKGSI